MHSEVVGVVDVDPEERLESYDSAVCRLLGCDYVVSSNERGYRVQHLTDADDISFCYTLSQLVDLADLMVWAKRHRAEQSPPARPA